MKSMSRIHEAGARARESLQNRGNRGAERGFVISDHADWAGLNAAIKATGAERIVVTHGYTSQFRRWLEDQGYDAKIVETEYEGETLSAPDTSPNTGATPGTDADTEQTAP